MKPSRAPTRRNATKCHLCAWIEVLPIRRVLQKNRGAYLQELARVLQPGAVLLFTNDVVPSAARGAYAQDPQHHVTAAAFAGSADAAVPGVVGGALGGYDGVGVLLGEVQAASSPRPRTMRARPRISGTGRYRRSATA